MGLHHACAIALCLSSLTAWPGTPDTRDVNPSISYSLRIRKKTYSKKGARLLVHVIHNRRVARFRPVKVLRVPVQNPTENALLDSGNHRFRGSAGEIALKSIALVRFTKVQRTARVVVIHTYTPMANEKQHATSSEDHSSAFDESEFTYCFC